MTEFDDDDVLDEPQEQQDRPEPRGAKADIALLKQSFRILSKKLSSETEALKNLGQEKAAKTLEANTEELDEVMPRVLDDKGIAGLNEKQRGLARIAVPLLAKNTKAAKGTLIGIGRDEWAAECVKDASYIEVLLAPQLEEQPELVESR